MMDEAAFWMVGAAQHQRFERIAQPLGINVYLRPAGGEKLRLPGCGIGAAGDHDAIAFQRPEDRKLGEWLHADPMFIPRLLQDIHR